MPAKRMTARTISSGEVTNTTTRILGYPNVLTDQRADTQSFQVEMRLSLSISGAAAMNDWLDQAVIDIVHLRLLPDRWDGQVAIAPSTETLKATLDFVSDIPVGAPPPDVSVNIDGSVAFEWQRGNFELSIDCTSNGPTHYYFTDGLTPSEGDFGGPDNNFEKWLWRLANED